MGERNGQDFKNPPTPQEPARGGKTGISLGSYPVRSDLSPASMNSPASMPSPGSMLRLPLLFACASAALVAAPAHANMMQQIIVGKCSSAMQADFQKAGKTPPAGMVNETCTCVANGMLRRGQSLDQAKTTCVKQSTAKYNL